MISSQNDINEIKKAFEAKAQQQAANQISNNQDFGVTQNTGIGGTITSGFIQSYPPPPVSSPCPACGYCPHCGRGGYQTSPYWSIYPNYFYQGITGNLNQNQPNTTSYTGI